MSESFNEDLQDVYSKTMKLAIDLAQNKSRFTNSPPSHNDKKFLRKMYKFYKDFQELKDKKKKKIEELASNPESSTIPQLKHNKTEFLPKDSGKNKLHSSIRERKNFVSESRAGKLSKFTEIGPGVIGRMKISSSIHMDDSLFSQSYEKTHNLPHVSVLTGKVKPALELPSFKEYVKSERSKDVKDQAFDKINRCQKHIEEFKKELTGLEIFINSNPGVPWNNDKKVLLKLNANPLQKNSIIKAYNRANHISGRIDLKPQNSRISRFESLTSKTPNHENYEKFSFPDTTKYNYNPLSIVEKCFKDFRDVREHQNKNLINIMDSLKVTRPVSLMEKAKYILNDKEKFRDRGYSLRKMDQIKRKIDDFRTIRLKKSLSQVKLYDNVMEFLKKKPAGPLDSEINLVEIIKEVLEEGWYIDQDLLDKILNGFDDEEVKELEPLIEFIRNELGMLDTQASKFKIQLNN